MAVGPASLATRLAGSPVPFAVAWVSLPFLLGPALADALDGRSTAVTAVVATASWTGWAAILLAVLLPRAVGLTAVRIVSPAAVVLALWAAAVADSLAWAVLGLAAACLAAVLAMSPGVGDRLADGSSYGDERRFLLRPPAALLLGPLPLAWLVVVAGATTGPLLLAAEQWVAGAAALVVGGPLAAGAMVRLHQLSRRWLVLVPAGLVVHDLLHLDQPVLLTRAVLRGIGPAPAASDALDLTGGAIGLALLVRLAEPVAFGVRRGRREFGDVDADAVLVGPTMPATLLAAAGDRRLPVG